MRKSVFLFRSTLAADIRSPLAHSGDNIVKPTYQEGPRGGELMPWLDPEESGLIDVLGGRVWYRINGKEHTNAVPLLVIHGGPGLSHYYMVPLVDLHNERPVVLYDQLDSGNSDHPSDPSNWTVDRFVSEIPAVRSALGLDRVVIFGNSCGGLLALEYALTKPEGLVGLVLSSPVISMPRWTSDSVSLIEALPEDLKEIIDEHEAAGTTDSEAYAKASGEFYKRHYCRLDPLPDFELKSDELSNYAKQLAMWGPCITATGSLRDYDRTSRLREINVPTLITCGQYDTATPTACRDFAVRIPNAELEVVADASRVAFTEKRKEYMTLLRRFLGKLS